MMVFEPECCVPHERVWRRFQTIAMRQATQQIAVQRSPSSHRSRHSKASAIRTTWLVSSRRRSGVSPGRSGRRFPDPEGRRREVRAALQREPGKTSWVAVRAVYGVEPDALEREFWEDARGQVGDPSRPPVQRK